MTPVIERSQAWRSLFACVTIGCGVTLAARGVSESWWLIVIGAAHLAAIWLTGSRGSRIAPPAGPKVTTGDKNDK